MFATLLAALAVVIALQALRLASRDRIVVQVQSTDAPTQTGPKLPWFIDQAAEKQLSHLYRPGGPHARH